MHKRTLAEQAEPDMTQTIHRTDKEGVKDASERSRKSSQKRLHREVSEQQEPRARAFWEKVQPWMPRDASSLAKHTPKSCENLQVVRLNPREVTGLEPTYRHTRTLFTNLLS